MRACEFIVEYKTEEYNGLRFTTDIKNGQLIVRALDDWGTNELGHVVFNIGDQDELDPQDLEVDERYQGQGIARTMYDYVKTLGYEIHRSWDQTPAGAGFWNKHRGEDVRVWEGRGQKYPGILPIGDYLGDDSGEFAPPVDYKNTSELHGGVFRLLDTGIEPKVVTVDPRRLLATQDWLRDGGGYGPLFDEYADKPVVYEKAGKFYILDGHHRTTKALQAGQPISVYLFSDQQMNENMDHSKDDRAVEELRAALLARKEKLQAASDDQVYDIIDRIMTRIARSHSISGQQLHDMWVDKYKEIPDTWIMNENFADGKHPGRKGLAKRVGVNCKQSVSKLRSIAAHSSGERQRMAHWCANMKSGRKK
jgi:GNAT superfamily N-acetyltransferase